jgi:hypothetical protein
MTSLPGEDAWWVYRIAAAVRHARMWRPWFRMLMVEAIAEVVAVEAEAIERRARELVPVRTGRP